MPEKRIIVTGGRDFGKKIVERQFIRQTLDEIDDRFDRFNLVIVHGGAKGVDTAADEWARDSGHEVEEHKARWHDMTVPGAYRPPGAAHNVNAGKDRNQKMADLGADLCIAFPGNTGTADMMRRAKAKGIPVIEMKFYGDE